MSISQRRLRLVVLLGLLVVAAGCQSASTDVPTERPTAVEPTATDAGIDLDEHDASLRAAGSVTVRSTTTMVARGNGSTTTRTQTRYAELNFESGRAFARLEPLGGAIRERYRSGGDAGKTYEAHAPAAYPDYVGPERSEEIDASRLVRVLPIDESALERRGSGTVDGVSGTVYVADSFEAVEPGGYDSLSPSDVTSFRVTYVVGDDGVVRYQRINLTARRDGVRVSESTTTEFSTVGSTTVTKPEWLEAAKSEANTPDHDDVVLRTYNATGDGGLAELAVAARKGNLAVTGAMGPQISDNPRYRADHLDRYRVGAIARYYYDEDSVRNVTIRVHYDDGAVAAENESDLQLVWLNQTTQLFEPVGSTVDTEDDVVSATVTDSETIERYQGKTFLVLRWPQYQRAWADGFSNG